MAYKRYIARRRARFQGLSGPVNLPYGTALECRKVYLGDDLNSFECFLFWKNKKLCAATCQRVKDYFVQDDDRLGKIRGDLVTLILARLGPKEARKGKAAGRWEKIWADPLCKRYKHPKHEEQWLWNEDFYNAPVDDLRHIARLAGLKI